MPMSCNNYASELQYSPAHFIWRLQGSSVNRSSVISERVNDILLPLPKDYLAKYGVISNMKMAKQVESLSAL